MQEIENLRTEIDLIHGEMAALFRRRLSLTCKIWDIKKQYQLPLIDSSREDFIIHQFDSLTDNLPEKVALQNFFKTILAESKTYVEAQSK